MMAFNTDKNQKCQRCGCPHLTAAGPFCSECRPKQRYIECVNYFKCLRYLVIPQDSDVVDSWTCPDCVRAEATHDPVNHPAHYTQGIECIDYIESKGMGFSQGNVIKYVTRYKQKNGLEDLKKAAWYLQRLIEQEGGGK